MKRVLIFSLAYYPKHIGGAEIAIKEITDRIDPNTVEFHMITLRFDSTLPKIERIGNILVHRIGFSKPNASTADLKKFPLHYNKILFQLIAPLKASSLHRTYHYDAIWAMMAHSTGVPAAIFNMFYPKVPYVLTLQEGDPPKYIEKLMRPLGFFFRRAFIKATIIQAISNFLGTWARQQGFTGDLEIIPNAVNTKHFSQPYAASEIIQLKEKIGKRPSDIYLITTSRLVHKNAIDDIIRALKYLPENIFFLVLGIGPNEEMLKDLAKEIKVENRVRWLGQIDHTEMPKYLKISDIFVRPSRSEGMGNSFIEAMAAGLPVVATQEGGIADFLFDAKRNLEQPTTGWAVDKNSPKQIAAAVEDILHDPGHVQTVIAQARALAFEKYDWNLIAKDMQVRVFEKVLKS